MITAAAILLPPVSAQAEGEAFEAYTSGRVLLFNWHGKPYGMEHYLPGRRVIWSFLDGQCLYGQWTAQQDEICFLYEDSESPRCWQYDIGPEGLTVSVGGDGDGEALTLRESREASPSEMLCLGPKVGV